MPNSYVEVTDSNHPTTISVSAIKYLDIAHLEALGTDGTYSGSGADSRSWTKLTVTGTSAVNKTVTVNNSGPFDTVRVFRRTPATQLVDFQNGSRLTEADLDTAYQQSLYVAQEVAENAAATTQPSAGIGGIDHTHIDGGGVTNVCLAGGITADKLSGGITNAQLAGSIDLTAKVTGVLPVANGGTGLSADTGQVLEEFLLPCDGNSYTARSGAYTPAAVNAAVDLTETYADVAGSSISYTPVTGTQIVIYKYSFCMSMVDSTPIAHFKLFLGSDEVTDARTTLGFGNHFDTGRHTIEWAFKIGGYANTATGSVSSWSGAKVIKLQAREYGSSNEGKLHNVAYWDGSASAQFSRPLLGIKAIG
tara:strand:- start:3331 stop:4419 length:1089 start_codon:yes stop_codon:yes gene_type:complete